MIWSFIWQTGLGAGRIYGQFCLKARAIENQAYCIGVNRVGKDGKEIDYSGDSEVIDPWGNTEYLATESRRTSQIFNPCISKIN
jgi:predicted amidohydrolase